MPPISKPVPRASGGIDTNIPGGVAAVRAGEEALEVSGAGLRAAELVVVALLGLLACPPLLILAVVVAVPAIAFAALVMAVVAAISVPAMLVRHVRAHHRAHGRTLFLHRVLRRGATGR